ncbi:response regulator transcription factor [Chloroflexota bacterium]
MPSGKETVLVVDDDVRMLRMTQRILELEGYRVVRADKAELALELFDSGTPDLVLLDIMMPLVDGYALCRRIREFSQVPIIMVTAKSSDEEKVFGLDMGADDYITKPFSAGELAARVRATLRRAALSNEYSESSFLSDGLQIDFARYRVALYDEEVKLTATEYKLISCLAQNSGRVLTPEQILKKVWGEGYTDEPHLLQVNVARLRKKLKDDPRNPRYILTRPGIGYMMAKGAVPA